MAKNKTILVCPLDWGLGHATRIVPVIDELNKLGAHVIIGADNRPLAFLQKRFPNNRFIEFPGFEPNYPKSGSMAMAMLKSFPKMKAAAKNANQLLQHIIDENKIDVVISDNRYELYSDKAYTVFITHQLNIQTPGITSIGKQPIQKIINQYIKKYDELWIPDFPEEPGLSGELSHVKKMPISNYYFIGPLSRLSLTRIKADEKKADLLILISGPEPQRTILEDMLIDQVRKTSYNTIILQGKPEESEVKTIDHIKIIPHLDDQQIAELMISAKYLICRPGYSTIMDLSVLNKKAIFIPTPGQTEQEYLAKSFKEKRLFYSENQKTFNLVRAIESQDKYSGKLAEYDDHLLLNAVNRLIKEKPEVQ